MIMYICSVLVIILDQLSKYYVQKTMHLGDSVNVLGNFFKITYIQNKGAAFGLLSKIPAIGMFLSAIKIIAIIAIIMLTKKIVNAGRLYQLGFGLVMGGAIGNLINRIIYGSVTDFLDFGIGAYRWYIFNAADSSICAGVGVLFLLTMKKGR